MSEVVEEKFDLEVIREAHIFLLSDNEKYGMSKSVADFLLTRQF